MIKLKTNNAEKINAGIKSIASELKTSCEKVKLLEGNEEFHNQMQCVYKSLSTENENNDYASEMLNLEDLVNEQSFYLNKTGVSVNTLENIPLDYAANILQETGIDDYNSNSLFTKYLSTIEKCNEKKKFIDGIDELINKLKIVIEQQNDLKCNLSNISYLPVGYTAKPIDTELIKSIETVDNYKKIVEVVKNIADIEKNQTNICKQISELKSEQNKMFHGLPPNVDQATMAVQITEQKMKSMSKQLVDKIGKK